LDLVGSLSQSGGIGALLALHDTGTNEAYLPGYDGNGNVAVMIDVATGALKATYEYSPFGQFLRKEGAYAEANPVRFSTKFTDEETGLVYYGRRYYDPKDGRFVGRDPIEEQGGLNLYAFVANGTVNRWDYLGMNWGTRWWEGVSEAQWADFDEDRRYDPTDFASGLGSFGEQDPLVARAQSGFGARRLLRAEERRQRAQVEAALAGAPTTLHVVGSIASGAVTVSDNNDSILLEAAVDTDTGQWYNAASNSTAGLPANVSANGHTVLLVIEEAQFRVVGPIASRLGADHQWLAVYKDGNLLGAAGLGNLQGVPGANGQRSPDSPYVSMGYVKDHANRMDSPSIRTQPVYFVDPTSVLSYIRLAEVNRNQGPWALGTNDCNTWCREVITNSTPQRRQLPQISAPGSNPFPIFEQVVYPADGSVRQPTTITTPGRGPG